MDNKVILDVVVDVQKDFITGALANPEAQTTVAHLAETARQNAEAGHWMFFTKDTHPDNYLSTREGKALPVMPAYGKRPGRACPAPTEHPLIGCA